MSAPDQVDLLPSGGTSFIGTASLPGCLSHLRPFCPALQAGNSLRGWYTRTCLSTRHSTFHSSLPEILGTRPFWYKRFWVRGCPFNGFQGLFFFFNSKPLPRLSFDTQHRKSELNTGGNRSHVEYLTAWGSYTLKSIAALFLNTVDTWLQWFLKSTLAIIFKRKA